MKTQVEYFTTDPNAKNGKLWIKLSEYNKLKKENDKLKEKIEDLQSDCFELSKRDEKRFSV